MLLVEKNLKTCLAYAVGCSSHPMNNVFYPFGTIHYIFIDLAGVESLAGLGVVPNHKPLLGIHPSTSRPKEKQ